MASASCPQTNSLVPGNSSAAKKNVTAGPLLKITSFTACVKTHPKVFSVEMEAMCNKESAFSLSNQSFIFTFSNYLVVYLISPVIIMGGDGDVNSLRLYVLSMILLGQGATKRWLSATQMKRTHTTSHRPHRHGPLGLFSGDKQVSGCITRYRQARGGGGTQRPGCV